MSSSNTNIQVADLDFNSIKNNFITYLQSQDTFKDYNFQGSSLSVLLDVLAYNTQYNAYYLNMVANEMFLDTALQRSSVVSQAKVLDYTPKSSIAPTAHIKLVAGGVTAPTITLPKYTNFLSAAVNGINYNFVSTDSVTVTPSYGTATFDNLEIKQGQASTYKFVVNSTTNPKYLFQIPDANIDTTTLDVLVQQSSSNTSYDIYQSADDYLSLDGNSLVYFLQEGLNGNYELYFGDGVLGKKLSDNNIVIVSYISTSGTAAAGANSFVMMSMVPGITTSVVTPITAADQGGAKESIDSIRFHAPKAYGAQKRAVTTEDYISILQKNKIGVSFDAVSVWGGQDNDPPIYGQVFISLKPSGGYTLTDTQKQRLINDVIKPVSVLTVEPTIVDPDYTYIKITSNILFDSKKTPLSSNGISNLVQSSIMNFATSTLNTFNSTFSLYDLTNAIQNSDQSIITNENTIQLQKKFYPTLSTPTTYKFYFNTPLQKGVFLSGISSSPSFQYQGSTNVISDVYLEELPSAVQGIDSISITNPGYGYQFVPTVTIYGDGIGATAEVVLNSDGSLKQINVLTAGSGYTVAYATITPQVNDTTGALGAVTVNLLGRYGTLRLYYNDTKNGKTVLNSNIGTVDYDLGVITLNSFDPIQINNLLGELTITVQPKTTIISSTFNRIITVDEFDPNAIVLNVTAK